MANRYVTSVNKPPYNHYASNDTRGFLQPASHLIRLKVCKFKDYRQYSFVEVSKSDTIAKLKERIAVKMNIDGPLQQFYLELFDERDCQWKKIYNKYSSWSISDVRLQPGDVLSVERSEYEVSSDQRPLYSATVNGGNFELKLRLCVLPMNMRTYTHISIYSFSTLGQLRKQAYGELNKLARNRPIYQWDTDQWMKYESSLDDCTLSDLGFKINAFISVDYDEDDSNSKTPPGLCGLANLGSTCYMNSVFQCLSNTPEFTKKLLAFDEKTNAPVIGQYIQLLKQVWSGKYRSIEPSSLVNNITEHLSHYDKYRQQDAQEFMNHFLHLIHAELSTKETLITELFYGRIRSTVKCLECQRIETTDESISFVPLPISNHNLKTVLYLKTDGEQRLISIQVDSSVYTIGDLIDCFRNQHEPQLARERIKVFRLVKNQVKELYEDRRSLYGVRDVELAFIECVKKSTREDYFWCHYVNRSTDKPFRPSSLVVAPTYTCRYSHLCDQIHQVLGHLCSITGAPVSACRVLWSDREGREYKLNVEENRDENLPYLKSIIIELDAEWVDKYREHYDFNHPTDKSGLCSLLADFCRADSLDGDYHCLKCPKLTKARQKSNLCLPLPPVLIIQLKRFTYDNYSNDKIDTFISFPLQGLDLNEYIVKDESQKAENNPSTKYDLVAVSNHTGSLTSGHYTTYAKNSEDGKWYSFDDRLVRKLNDEQDVVTKNAYILVYVQRKTDEK